MFPLRSSETLREAAEAVASAVKVGCHTASVVKTAPIELMASIGPALDLETTPTRGNPYGPLQGLKMLYMGDD